MLVCGGLLLLFRKQTRHLCALSLLMISQKEMGQKAFSFCHLWLVRLPTSVFFSEELFCWLRQTIAWCTLVKVLPGWKLLCLLHIEIEVKEGKTHLPKADLNNPGNSADLKLETGKFPLQASCIEMVSHVSALVPILLPREIWDQTQSSSS